MTDTIATNGWRAVRYELADLGEILAITETTHDCTRSGDAVTVDCHPLPGIQSPRHGVRPWFCAINRHGTPQTAYPLSVRSITTIVATRLTAAAAAARVDDPPGAPTFAGPAGAGPWSKDDHARVVAYRQAATRRLASFETLLDEADAYAEAVLQRLDSDLNDTARPDGSQANQHSGEQWGPGSADQT